MVMFINDKHGELLGQERRRRWSPEQNLAMVRESLEPGKAFRWWPGATVSMPTSCSCGASCIRTAACRRSARAKPQSDALKQIRELQRMLGKKTMEAESLKEAVEFARSRKWIAHSPLLPGDDQ